MNDENFYSTYDTYMSVSDKKMEPKMVSSINLFRKRKRKFTLLGVAPHRPYKRETPG